MALQKLVVLGRSLAEIVPELPSYDFGTSDDAPSMVNNRQVRAVWLYITRPSDARTVLASRLSKMDLANTTALFDIAIEHQHACVLLALDLHRFLIEFHISPRAAVDRMNAENKLSYQEDRTALAEMLAALPEWAEAGFEGELFEANSVDSSTIEDWASRWSDEAPFVVRLPWDRADEALETPDFIAEVQERFAEIWPIFQLLAWSRDNDFAKVGVEATVEKVEKKMRKTSVQKKASELALGARVTILSGLFAGRAGYLAESDGKGQVKVMVGPVSVSVAINDIKPM